MKHTTYTLIILTLYQKTKNVFISENVYKHKNKAINQIEKLSLDYFITVLYCNSILCVINLNANKKKIKNVLFMYT